MVFKKNKESNKDSTVVSLEDLDKQFEFYNKTLNQYEILNHNYTLKLDSFQKTTNNLNNQIKNLKKENEDLKKQVDSLNEGKTKRPALNIPPVVEEDFQKGIVVLVPTYKAERFVLKFLDSMKKQTLDYDLFEVLFVINGERDNTENLIDEFIQQNPEINITVIESEPGATTARNAGIDILNREYVTFIDVDDFISPGYLEITYQNARPNRIVIGNYYDIDENTGELSETYFTRSLSKFKGVIDPYSVAQGALLIATNKVMPTKYIKTIKFNPNLKSGDDHEYFCRLYSQYDFEFYFVGDDCDAIYYRLVVSNSVSRQPTSFDFNIIQRLEVMNEVETIWDNLKNPKMEKLLDRTMNSSQMTFINRYLEEFPDQYPKVLSTIKSYELNHFNYEVFNNNAVRIMNKIIDAKSKELNDVEQERNKLKYENEFLISAEGNNDELICLKNRNNDLESDAKELLGSIRQKDEYIKNLEKEKEELSNYNDVLSKSLHRSNRKIHDFKIQNRNLKSANDKLSSLNDDLVGSTSWKVTKPLRKLRHLK